MLYTGKVKHHGKVYGGEQPAIIEPETWEQTNRLLGEPCRTGEPKVRSPQGALLSGLLVCGVCGSRMVPGYTEKKGCRYAYYVCSTAQKRGARTCPRQSVTARRIELAVVEGVQQWAAQSGPEEMRAAVIGEWEQMEGAEQQATLSKLIDRIRYNGRQGQASLYWAGDVAGEALTVGVRPKGWHVGG